MYLTSWNRGRATSQRESARHSFCVREHLRQQGAKSENGPSFVCLYIPCLVPTFGVFRNFCPFSDIFDGFVFT
jgi:hypothetical protein